MTENIYTYPIPQQVGTLLRHLVERARENQIITFVAISRPSTSEIGTRDYQFEFISGDKPLEMERLFGRPEYTLEALGFIKNVDYQSRRYLLTGKAYEWVDYQQKNRLRKWYIRNKDKIGEFFKTLLLLLTALLTVLQVLGLISQ